MVESGQKGVRERGVCGLTTTMLLKPSIGCGYRTRGDVVGQAMGTEFPAHSTWRPGPKLQSLFFELPNRGFMAPSLEKCSHVVFC